LLKQYQVVVEKFHPADTGPKLADAK
jgi:hypothetical protein